MKRLCNFLVALVRLIGWAQVNGRNRISWEQKFEYDI